MLLCLELSHGQFNIGIPDIRNYLRSEYKAGSQNWGIAQDAHGIMYFGNNEGLLSFDGNQWRLYPLSLKGNVRSLATVGDRIYIGGQEEIGYFEPGVTGDLQYHSLKELIPAPYRHDFAEVWNVVVQGKRVFFRSNRKIFLFENGKISFFSTNNWSFLGKVGNAVYAFDDTYGLRQYENGRWKVAIPKEAFPPNVQVSGLLQVGGLVWIVTYSHGIFKWDGKGIKAFSTPSIDDLKSRMMYGAVQLSASEVAFVTNLSGCVVLDTAGRFVNRFTHKEGLQNNNVICAYADKDKNLWLGLGDGIDIVEYDKPIRNILPGEDGPIAGYTSAVYRDDLFLGTATGVYKTKYDASHGIQSSYENIPAASGQTWNLTNMDNRLFVGLNKAAVTYTGDQLTEINKRQTGFWNFEELPGTDFIVAGTYNGLHYFKKVNGSIQDVGIEALFESAKFVAIDGRTIWAMHPYKGLYRIDLSPDGLPVKTTALGQADFLSGSNNHLFKVDGRVVVTSDKGIFEWNRQKKTFVPSAFFMQIFGNGNLEYLKTNSKGDYWFVQNGRMGIAAHVGDGYVITYIPELNGRLQFGEYQDIDLLNDSCAIVAGEKGFFYIDYAQYKSHEKDFELLVRSFHIQTPQKDSMLFGGYQDADRKSPALAYKYNSVLLTYTVPAFGYASTIQYSYMLEGFDQTWSNWSEKNEKNYTNLPPGRYRFYVKAHDEYSGKEKMTSFDFAVLAPWYRTNLAYFLYFVALVAAIYWFSLYQHRRYIAMQTKKLAEQAKEHEKRRRELELQHNLEQEKKEKQLVEMTNEKLAMELEMKNTAIASNAMLLVQKGELLSKVKKDLSDLLDNADEPKQNTQLKKIIKTVDAELNNKDDWEKFASHFDTVHENYLQKLKETHPQLTYGDLKLCALLRLGMSSKEIAGILNISLKGVEVGRYRLRKKLNIPESQSLFDFLTGQGEAIW
ncbi:MAG: triple tyrosine motif-containing protein [Chitinophagaceae bacterium]